MARNVADLVVLPKMQRRKVEAMTPEQAHQFMEAAKSDRYFALWSVLLSGGLRPGEVIALTWSDLDLDQSHIHVQRSLVRRGTDEPWKLVPPKTDKGRRVVVLPVFAVRALRAHRAAQAQERLLVGGEYVDDGFVFATEFGRPLDASNLYDRNFRRIMSEAGLGVWVGEGRTRKFEPAFRMYDLRHTAATLLLRAGVHPKVVSERLGHASVAFTLDVYSASLPDMQESAAEALDAMLGGA